METDFDNIIAKINKFNNNIDSYYTEEDMNQFKIKYNESIQGIRLLLQLHKKVEPLDSCYKSCYKHYMSYKNTTMKLILQGFSDIIEECKSINSNINSKNSMYPYLSLYKAYNLSIEILNVLTKPKFDYIMVHDLLSIYMKNCERFISEETKKLNDMYEYECIVNKNKQWKCPICTEHEPQDNLVWISTKDPMEEYRKNGHTIPEPCGHKFHESCISEWFKTNNTCPLDRIKVDFIMHYKPDTNHDD